MEDEDVQDNQPCPKLLAVGKILLLIINLTAPLIMTVIEGTSNLPECSPLSPFPSVGGTVGVPPQYAPSYCELQLQCTQRIVGGANLIYLNSPVTIQQWMAAPHIAIRPLEHCLYNNTNMTRVWQISFSCADFLLGVLPVFWWTKLSPNYGLGFDNTQLVPDSALQVADPQFNHIQCVVLPPFYSIQFYGYWSTEPTRLLKGVHISCLDLGCV